MGGGRGGVKGKYLALSFPGKVNTENMLNVICQLKL